MNLSDQIESLIKEMLSHSGRGVLEVQRHELAQRFGCVPSQITYVLTTRFTPERGFIVESRRGGGGGLRIQRLDPAEEVGRILRSIGGEIGMDELDEVLLRWGSVTGASHRELLRIKGIVLQEAQRFPLSQRGIVQAIALRVALAAVWRGGDEDGL